MMGSSHTKRSVGEAPQHGADMHSRVGAVSHPTPSSTPLDAGEAGVMHVTVTPPTPPSAPLPTPAAAPSEAPGKLAVASQQQQQLQQQQHRKAFTMAEVQQMLSVNPNRTLLIIRNRVYDVSTFLSDHPGGGSVLRRNNGKDVTDAFYSMHSASAVKQLPAFLLGELVTQEQQASAASPITMTDIKHALGADPKRIILLLFGDAYDVTPMRDEHPGGLRVLTNNNGRECGDTFMRIHGLRAKKMVQQFYMGPVEGAASRGASPLRPGAAAGNGAVARPAGPQAQSTRILEMEPVNAAASIQYFTFACPTPLHMLPGGHIKLFSNLQRGESRFYTPFKAEVASFTICMKHYPQGRTSSYFFARREGDEVFFDGPLAPSWQLNTDAAVRRAAAESRHILLLAGGTGIAPLYSISSNALTTQSASVTLVCSVHTPDDLILTTEIHQLAARYSRPLQDRPHTLRVVLVFSRVSPEEVATGSLSFASHVLSSGRLTGAALRGLEVASAQAAVICGPPAFNDALAMAVLEAGICTAAQVHCL